MRLALFIVLAAALWFGIDDWRMRSLHPAPGVLVAEAPEQRDLPASTKTAFAHVGYSLTPRARFRVTARVLASERYRFARGADLMPRDLALGWGVMSDSAVLDQLHISQSDRFYFWRTRSGTAPVPVELINVSSANMHLIPANDQVAQLIHRVRVGQIVTLEGRLVDVQAPDGGTMKTSLTREDTGAGACEIIYVESAQVQ